MTQTIATEVLIYPPKVYHYENGKPVEVDYKLFTESRWSKKAGDKIVSFAAAPGCGRIVHQITRIDDTGIYGIEIENTIRELKPEEVI